MAEVNAAEWDVFLQGHSHVHLLQTSTWGELKASFGWQAYRVTNGMAGAQILFRPLPLGFSLAYIPKGPVGENWQELIPEIDAVCRSRRTAFLRLEPDLWESPGENLTIPDGFLQGNHPVQPLRTIIIDLSFPETELLRRMKQKTRYNIRLAEKKGVAVHASQDIKRFYEILQTTGKRDGFGVHSLEYYQQVYDLFHPQGACELLLAEINDQLLAGLMVFRHQQRAWYFYGASSEEHRNLMPTYLLQWEAIRWAKSQGCTEYDLWGIPDYDESFLEAEFPNRSDGLWGVYRFKRGFGGVIQRGAGPWDRVYHPLLYSLYRKWARGES
jgi:lipid II:glycine glycyltransferase (peptidoglycan interpeptide bridge formation enzyme)